MSLRYLLDTNIVSEPLRPKPRRGVLRSLRRHEEELAIPSLVWHELLYGAARLPVSRKREVIERYLEEVVLSSMPILDYDREAAEWHASERARLSSRGEMPAFVDGQIAAIAVVHELTLVTLNVRDFARFDGLAVAAW